MKTGIILFKTTRIIMNVLPEKIRYFFADIFGILLYYFYKKRRIITLKNLEMVFPRMTENERVRLAKQNYKHIAKNIFETMWIKSIFEKDKVSIVNSELLDRYRDKKGIIIISLHIGNWELGAYLSKKGYKITTVAKKQKSNFFDEYAKSYREMYDSKTIYKGKSSKELIRVLRNKEILILLSDQYMGDEVIEFFGMKTKAPNGAALLALKMDVPVILAHTYRNKDNSHEIRIVKEIELINTGDTKKDINANTQNFIYEIEKIIKKYPEQWFWQHNRWRIGK